MGYKDIATDLRRRIKAGEYPTGEKLPTIVELMAIYGVARQTVRAAVAELAREQLVRPIRHHGTVVLGGPDTQRITRTSIQQVNRAYYVDAVTARTATTDEARALNIRQGRPVLAIRRTTYTPQGTATHSDETLLPGDHSEVHYEAYVDGENP